MATSKAACAGSNASGGTPNQASEPARIPSRLPPNGASVSQMSQHAVAAVAGFELQRARHLDQLGAQRARAGFEQPGGLHRQRRTAGDHVAAADELGGGTCQSERVDAGVVPEAAVLDGDQ